MVEECMPPRYVDLSQVYLMGSKRRPQAGGGAAGGAGAGAGGASLARRWIQLHCTKGQAPRKLVSLVQGNITKLACSAVHTSATCLELKRHFL